MKSAKDFFNGLASSWDEICQHDMDKVEFILNLVGIQQGSKVLDVGTGTGVLIPSLSRRTTSLGHIKAIDLAEKMIEIAQEKNKYDNVEFECGDVLESNGDQASYDHIICYSSFPHFQCKATAIAKLSQKLKKGGKLTICHSQSREMINRLHQRSADPVKEDNLPAMEIIRQYYHRAGLKVLKEVDDQAMFVLIGGRFQ